MKSVSAHVLSKGRKYYKAKIGNYDWKIVSIDELEIDKVHELLVEDISVRSKFGTDLIYSTVQKIDKNAGIVTLTHDRYNKILVDKCKKLGGKWDAEEKSWIFPKIVENDVEELDALFNDNIVDIEITAKEMVCRNTDAISIFGYTICRAFGRDSGAKLADNVSMVKGVINSGGSVKNWKTIINEGSVFRLAVSKNLVEKIVDEEWDIKILN